jgi:hypothetical protein
VLLAVDAISRRAELEGSFNAGRWDSGSRSSPSDASSNWPSANAWLVFGHDPEQRLEVQCAPATYD